MIMKEIEKNSHIHFNELIEWAFLTSKLLMILEALNKEFKVKLLENYSAYARILVPESVKLSNVFAVLE